MGKKDQIYGPKNTNSKDLLRFATDLQNSKYWSPQDKSWDLQKR